MNLNSHFNGEFRSAAMARKVNAAPVTPHGRSKGEFPPAGTAHSAHAALLNTGVTVPQSARAIAISMGVVA